MVTHRVQLVYVDGTEVLEPGYSSVSVSPHSTTSQGTLRSLPLVIIFYLASLLRILWDIHNECDEILVLMVLIVFF